jgi:hypothetical protein
MDDNTLFDGTTVSIFGKILEEIAEFRPVFTVLGPYMTEPVGPSDFLCKCQKSIRTGSVLFQTQ